MTAWWSQLSGFEHVYWIIAVPSTLALLVQLILSFLAGFELQHDFDVHDGDLHSAGGDIGGHFQLLTVRNVVAFFAMCGWSGLALYHGGFSKVIVILGSCFTGFVMMVIIAAIFLGISKLVSSGTIELKSAVNSIATVYVPIPPNRSGTGKINATIEGKVVEIGAVTDDTEKIATGTSVRIKDIVNNQYVVERM